MLDRHLDHALQYRWRDRTLRNVILCAFLHRLHSDYVVAVTINHNYRKIRMPDACPPQYFDAVDARHKMIEQDTIRNMLFNRHQTALAVLGFHKLQNIAKCTPERSMAEFAVASIIIDNQYS